MTRLDRLTWPKHRPERRYMARLAANRRPLNHSPNPGGGCFPLGLSACAKDEEAEHRQN